MFRICFWAALIADPSMTTMSPGIDPRIFGSGRGGCSTRSNAAACRLPWICRKIATRWALASSVRSAGERDRLHQGQRPGDREGPGLLDRSVDRHAAAGRGFDPDADVRIFEIALAQLARSAAGRARRS